MIIKFSNLGAIQETELDLRPLTVIIGPNNTNKTYLAYSLSGLWSRGHGRVREASAFDGALWTLAKEERLTDDKRSLKIPLTALRKYLQTSISTDAQLFAKELGSFFQDTSGKVFQRAQISVSLSDEDVHTGLRRAGIKHDDGHVLIPARGGGSSSISFGSAGPRSRSELVIHNTEAHRELLGNLDKGCFLPPFLLPAERNALVITYKLLSSRRLKLLRDASRSLIGTPKRGDEGEDMQRKLELLREQGEIRYPLPVEDFLDFLTDVELLASRGATLNSGEFDELIELVETRIAGGNRLAMTTTALGGRELRIAVKDDLSIDLYNASSSIKQLTPLLLYLRYRATKNQLLIIDEPEMNLHPESQAKLLEVLAMMVNMGVHVLLTTHSPYFMAHLANLAQRSDKPASRNKQAKNLYLNDPRALLTMDQVGAYEIRDNKLSSLKDPDYGIRWDTLSDVFSTLQQKYFALHELAHPPGQAKPEKAVRRKSTPRKRG